MQCNGKILRLMLLVPEGLGGKEIDGVLLVGETSPLGVKLKGLGIGDCYEINGERYEIVNFEK